MDKQDKPIDAGTRRDKTRQGNIIQDEIRRYKAR